MTIQELKNAIIAEAEALMNSNEMIGRTADELNICVSIEGRGHRNNYWYATISNMSLGHFDGGNIEEIRITEDGMVYININLYQI